MNILTIYANPSPRSFCHAILERFSQGLADAGHSNEVFDLYAMRFNPVLTARDYPCWIDENIPFNTLGNMILENSGGFIQRFVLERWLRNNETAQPECMKNLTSCASSYTANIIDGFSHLTVCCQAARYRLTRFFYRYHV
jgi:NAD(P)H dehydrogenase (quinone)